MYNGHRRKQFLLSFILFLFVLGTSGQGRADAVTRGTVSDIALRVCADPNNLPFSNDKLQGFENKIIELIATELDRPVSYSWFPQTIGYVRNTLRLHKCDLITGISTTNERVQNTNPYYHSIYTLVYAAQTGDLPANISDPVYKNLKIGIVAGTPPANLMAQYGLLSQIRPYQLTVDTRHYSAGQQMIEDIAAGIIDTAIIWGPIAGYYAAQSNAEMVVLPLIEESKKMTLDFSITMAVRYNDQQWKHEINQVLDQLKPQIVSILKQYHVPLLNNLGQLIEH